MFCCCNETYVKSAHSLGIHLGRVRHQVLDDDTRIQKAFARQLQLVDKPHCKVSFFCRSEDPQDTRCDKNCVVVIVLSLVGCVVLGIISIVCVRRVRRKRAPKTTETNEVPSARALPSDYERARRLSPRASMTSLEQAFFFPFQDIQVRRLNIISKEATPQAEFK